jgi:hypothetical protein
VSGYYLSYLYRSINALISEALVSEFGLSPGNLGFLTATYFLAFGLIQLPLGVWLTASDRDACRPSYRPSPQPVLPCSPPPTGSLPSPSAVVSSASGWPAR